MYMEVAEMKIDLGLILRHLADIIVALASIMATIYASSKRVRTWVNDKLKNTNTIKNLETNITNMTKAQTEMLANFKVRDEQLQQTCDNINELFNKLNDKVDRDNATTLLTLKYEILDICTRADENGCITRVDKELLCEMYKQYVDVWQQNHYVKSEIERVLSIYKVVDEYGTKAS